MSTTHRYSLLSSCELDCFRSALTSALIYITPKTTAKLYRPLSHPNKIGMETRSGNCPTSLRAYRWHSPAPCHTIQLNGVYDDTLSLSLSLSLSLCVYLQHNSTKSPLFPQQKGQFWGLCNSFSPPLLLHLRFSVIIL